MNVLNTCENEYALATGPSFDSTVLVNWEIAWVKFSGSTLSIGVSFFLNFLNKFLIILASAFMEVTYDPWNQQRYCY